MTMLCSNRPEGFGPKSHLYSHILTSCFLDTILVPLCTWLYLLTILVLFFLPGRSRRLSAHLSTTTATSPSQPWYRRKGAKTLVKEDGAADSTASRPRRGKLAIFFTVLFYLFLLAQILMCTLEIVRLALAHYGIGLLPFTYVTLLMAGGLKLTHGLRGKIGAWRWANLAVFLALAICNAVKVAEEVKEGIQSRKGTKYPESDEIIDVAVMIGVYVALIICEVLS